MDPVETTETIEQKIINSGIFKLDEQSRPTGIIKLAADKSLSMKPKNWLPCDSEQLRETILKLSREVAKYHLDPRDRLEELLKEFEDGLVSYFTNPDHGWGLDIKELSPHFEKVVSKAKRIIRKNLKPHTEKLRKLDPNRAALIFKIHQIFSECWPKSRASIGITDCNRYIAYLLKACGIESGATGTVFKRIDRAFHRYRDTVKKIHPTRLPDSYYEVY